MMKSGVLMESMNGCRNNTQTQTASTYSLGRDGRGAASVLPRASGAAPGHFLSAIIFKYCRALCAASLCALPQEIPEPWQTVMGLVESSARH